MSRRCVVVGAGLAGLTAAYRLANAGVHVTVLESAPEPGGRARSERVGDFILNTGAGFVTNYYTQTFQLMREFRLEAVHPGERSAVAATPFGKFAFEIGSPKGVVRFPLVPVWGKLRALWLFGRLYLGRRSDLADLNSLAHMDGRMSLDQWGRRNLGEAAYEYLLRAAVESLFYYDAKDASAAIGEALVRQAANMEILFPKDGMGALTAALARRLLVRTGCAATCVEVSGDRVLVRHAGGVVEADYAILALPAGAAAALEGTIAAEDRNDLQSIRYAPTIVLFFGYERSITVQHHSVTPSGPGRHPIASVWTLSRWIPSLVPKGKEMIVIYSSGWRAEELLDAEPGKAVAALRTDAEEIFGRMADPDWIRIYPHRGASVIPAPGHFARMLAFSQRKRDRILFAGDWLTGSTVEGAIRTGLQAADKILATG